MYEFLQGELVSKSPAAAVLCAGGIGYHLRIPLSTYESLPREGQSVRLLTHLHVREDELTLYGFATEVERDLFRMLLGVSQIGPMVALRVLSSCTPAQFKRYILHEDVEALSSMIKGVGAKTARRLIIELQGPVRDLAVAAEETDLVSIDPLEPPPMGDCHLAEIKHRYGHRLVLKGNLHTTDVMLRGTRDDVLAASRRCIRLTCST